MNMQTSVCITTLNIGYKQIYLTNNFFTQILGGIWYPLGFPMKVGGSNF